LVTSYPVGLFSPPAKDSVPVPATAYMGMSFSYIGAMYFSNLALGYMSYPAQALAKSCKLIPVMLSRLFLMRDVSYTRREVFQVVAITAGIGVFMLGAEGSGHGKKERETSWVGLGLCILALALDGYTGPAQERLNKSHKLSMATMMFYLNAWAILIVGVGLMVTGEMWKGLAFCTNHPAILTEAAMFSLMASSGQALILYTLLQFNSLVVVTVTTTRKFFTILLSVVAYGHALTTQQWSGVALVFAGLSIDIYAKYADSGKGHGKHGGKAKDTPAIDAKVK
jgi:UDP-galactose transporter B1